MTHNRSTPLPYITLAASMLAVLTSVFCVPPARAELPVAWLTQYGTSSADFGSAIAVDAAGQSWVAGSTHGNLGGTGNSGLGDLFLTRMSATGNVDFTQQRGTSGEDASYGVALLGSGTVFTGGFASGTLDGQTFAGVLDAAILRYDTNGAWRATHLFGNSSDQQIRAIAANGTNLFTVGETFGALNGQTNPSGYDAFLTRNDASGGLLWTRLVSSSATVLGSALALDSAGNSYMTGRTQGSIAGSTNVGGTDIFLARYDFDGNQTLLQQFGTAADDVASGIKIDISGNIYLTGSTYGNLAGQINAGSADAFVTKLDSAGNMLWTRLFGGLGVEWGRALDVDSVGNVWIGGLSESTFGTHTNAGDSDAFVAQYDSNGNLLGTRFFATSKEEWINGLAIGPDGSAYVTGYTFGSLAGSNSGGNDVFVAKVANVPEPGSALLFLLGGAFCLRRHFLHTRNRNA